MMRSYPTQVETTDRELDTELARPIFRRQIEIAVVPGLVPDPNQELPEGG